jgi:predicted permease
MRWKNWLDSLRAVFRRGALNHDIDDELRFHLEMQAAQLAQRGVSADEARRRAMVAFGGVERYAEECRDTRGVRWLDETRQDLRVAIRSLRGAPSFTLVVLATLALGVGATTAVFSVVYGILLRPLPYAASDRVVMVWENDRVSRTEREAASVPDYFDFIERNRSFEHLAGFTQQQFNLAGEAGEPVRVSGALVTHGLPQVLGVAAARGRFPTAEEDRPGGARVAVLSDRLWRTQFGASPATVGSMIRLDDQAYQVVGVLPADVEFPSATTDIWLALQFDRTTTPRSLHQLNVIARLRDGVSTDAAQRDMTRIASELENEFHAENVGRGVSIEPIADVILGPVRRALFVLFGAVGVVLLIGCANLANLMLARGANRGREVSVRSVLGATSFRLIRQFLVEIVLLVGAGLALAWVVARWLLSILLAIAPNTLPRLSSVRLDLVALLFAVGAGALIAALFGVLPALDARRVRLQDALKTAGTRVIGGRAQVRFRSALVVTQIGLSVLLVTSAGLLLRSFWALQQVDPGFTSDQVLRASFRLPVARYPQSYQNYPNWNEVHRFYTEAIERVAALPGVRVSSMAAHHPLGRGFTNSFLVEGREAEAANWAEIPVRPVTHGYFGTVGVPLKRGRLFAESDRADAPPVAVINDVAARKYFPADDPIGKRIRFWGTSREIVGIVGNERFYGLTEEPPPAVYTPLTQTPMGTAHIILRASVPPDELTGALRSAIAQVDPGIALFDVEPLQTTVESSVAPQRFTATLLTIFAVVALLLALVGIHGLISYAVAQRSREAGIRAALGASPGQVVGLMVREGGRLAVLGSAIGVLGALLSTHLLQSLLFGVGANDPATFAGVLFLTCLTVGSAIYLPARRLARVSPASALRAE